MATATTALISLDLAGTLAFAINGSMTAIRMAKLDIVGVVTLGMMTALGGGFLRDILLNDLPPATFLDWRYLAVAAAGGFLAFGLSHHLERLAIPINVLDAAGLSLFAVNGTLKGLEHGLGSTQAIILGIVTGVGGGTLRDVLIRQIPAPPESCGEMTYALLNVIFLTVLVGITMLLYRGASSPYRWIIVSIVSFLLIILTIVFDSIMIWADLFRFDPALLLGVTLWLAPIEDLAWPLAAALFLPALWTWLHRNSGN